MPGYVTDEVTHIINVQWSGGAFAVIGTARDTTKEGPIGCFYAKDGRKWNPVWLDPTTPKPPEPMEEPGEQPREPGIWYNYLNCMVGGEVRLITGAIKRVIVAGGFRSEMIGADIPNPDDPSFYRYNYQTTATLFYSGDGGKTWEETTNPVTAEPDGTFGVHEEVQMAFLAFDPIVRTFYGDVSKTMGHVISGALHQIVERHLISSTDGRTWKIEQTETHDISAGGEPWLAPFPTKLQDIRNNGLTEIGVYAPTSWYLLTYQTVEFQESIFGGGIKLVPPWQIKLQRPTDMKETIIDITGITYGPNVANGSAVKGFAYANGVFLIAGSLMLEPDNADSYRVIAYISSDGTTWQKTLDDDKTFVTIDPFSSPGIGPAGSTGCGG